MLADTNGETLFPGDQDLIGTATSGEDVISALARRGCSDLTVDIDLPACSTLPRAGGGFCDVYRGILNCGRHIAIKSLRLYDRPGKDNEKKKILKRAARELYHWSKLKHSNILPLMGLAMFRGHLSMISEWMENGSLIAYISLNPDVDRIGLCVDICAGLSHIHAHEMVHGDIKAFSISFESETLASHLLAHAKLRHCLYRSRSTRGPSDLTVMVSPSGIAMIADFGNSQIKDLTLRFTNTTSFSFSVRWAAPELLLGEGDDSQVSKQSDVYAYGMTILETITGKVPFEEFGEQKVLALVAVLHQTPARPEVGISDEIWEILQRCWTRDRSARPDIINVGKSLRDTYCRTWIETKGRENFGTDHCKMNNSTTPHVEPNATGVSDDPFRHYETQLRKFSELAGEHARKGQLAEAELLDVEVVTVHKRVFGEDHPGTLLSLNNLAVTYMRQGRLAEAESLGAEVVAARKRVLGDDHPDTLQSMSNLALTYKRHGRLAEAESLEDELAAITNRVLGKARADALQSMHILALIYEKQGRLADAESLSVQVVAVQKRMLGEDHPDTLRSVSNLAVTYEKQGRLAEAESLEFEVVAFRKRVLGEDHSDTLHSMSNLATIYKKQGRLGEAELLSAEVVATKRRVLGEDHLDTLRSMSNLAVTYNKQNRLAEAESLGLEVVAARKRLLGEDHPDTLHSMSNLAVTYNKQNRLVEAEALGVEVIAIRKHVLGKHHPDTLRSMINLVITYEKQDRLPEAEWLGAEVVAFAQQVFGEDHPDTLRSMSNLAVTYEKQGQLLEAESLGVHIVATRARVLGEDHLDTLRSMKSLAITYKKQGRRAEAESLGVQVLATQEWTLGKHHPETVNTLRWLKYLRRA